LNQTGRMSIFCLNQTGRMPVPQRLTKLAIKDY
jgi:hypothetical protein